MQPFRPSVDPTPAKFQRARELREQMTLEERLLWDRLRRFRSRGYPFRRQQVIAGFIADFYCHVARLVVEVDGGIHNLQREYDAERDVVLRGHDLAVIRITNDDVQMRLDDVVVRIEMVCRERASER